MTSHSTITTLFTDVGGVLLTNGWDRAGRSAAAERFGLDLEELNERHHLTYDTYESGKLSLDDYLRRIVFHEPRAFTPQEFRGFMFDLSQPLPGMIDLVRRLKARHGIKVAVVSNEGRELMEHRIRRFELGRFVDFFIASCFVHVRKPDTDIFRMALDTAQVRPEHAVYLEDRPMFVQVADGLGLRGIHHTSVESTRRALDELGLTDPD